MRSGWAAHVDAPLRSMVKRTGYCPGASALLQELPWGSTRARASSTTSRGAIRNVRRSGCPGGQAPITQAP